MPHDRMSQDLVSFTDAPVGWRAKRQIIRAHRAQLSSDLGVLHHGREARARAEMDEQDSRALGDAARTALDEELGLMRHGLAQAGQSAAAIELTAGKVELVANANNRRLARRFRG